MPILKIVVARFVSNLLLDIYPETAAEIVDFGFNNVPNENAAIELFSAYRKGLVTGLFTEQELENAVGDGIGLTALVERAGYKHIVKTDYDDFDDF